MKRGLFFIMLMAVLYSATTFTSCKKKADTKAVITVIDTLGVPAANVSVTLWQDTAHNPITGAKSSLRVSNITDGSGNAEFTFANEAFLNIWATRILYGTDTAFGFIRLEQNNTVNATVHF